jgi:putative RecB family exonuclease
MTAAYRRTTPYSFTRFDLFETCPAAFRFKYIDKVPETPSRPLLLGSFIHEVLEHYNKHLYGNHVQTDVTSLPLIARRLFYAKPTGLTGNDLAEVEAILTRYAGSHILNLNTYAGSEELMRWDIDDQRTVWCKVDELHIDGDIALINDFKTDHQLRTRAEVGRDMQLKIYCWMAKQHYPQVNRFAVALDFVRHGVVLRVPAKEGTFLELDAVADADTYIRGMIQLIEAERKWEPKPGAGCAWCAYIDRCPAIRDTSFGSGRVVIASDAEAAAAANQLALLDAQSKRLKDGLKVWCNAAGTVESNGLAWGFHLTPSLRIDDVPGFIHAAREAGHDVSELLAISTDDLRRATRRDAGLEAIADDWLVDHSYTSFRSVKTKGGDDE